MFFIFLSVPTYAAGDNGALIQLLFTKAFGNKQKAVPLQSTADLRINKIQYGEIEVYSKDQQKIDAVNSSDLLEILKEVLKDDVINKIKKESNQQAIISLSQLAKVNISAVYNTLNISLDLSISPDMRRPRVISMQRNINSEIHTNNILQKSDISGYINLYSDLDISNNTHNPKLRLHLDGSLNIHKTVLESTLNFNDSHWEFDNTTITYDKPDKLYRYQLGSISTITKGFQDSYSLTGISLTKAFFMDPKRQINPKANASFILETDSVVEVMINEKVQQQYHLEAGVYTLDDIGLFEGANNIVIRIIDSFGKITKEITSQYYDTKLLKPDLSNFSVSLGVPKDQQEKTENKRADKFLFSGFYQRGLSKSLTLGFDAQLSASRLLIGSEVITASSIGRLQLNSALSTRMTGKLAVGSSFNYYPVIPKKWLNTRVSSLNIQGEYKSQYFDETTAIGTGTRNTNIKLQTRIGLRLSEKWNSHFVLGASSYHNEDDAEFYSAISLSRHFDHGISWNMGYKYSTYDDFILQSHISIPLSKKRFNRKQYANFRYDSRNNSLESHYEIKPRNSLGESSLAGSLRHIQSDTQSQFSADLSYRNPQFETHISARQAKASQQLNVGFNASLLCINEQSCAFSYPISDSFAFVAGPSNQDKPIAIKDHAGSFNYDINSDSDLPDNYTSLIKNKDSQAVISLNSFEYKRISIDEGSLPLGYDPDKTEFEVIPDYHAGYYFSVGGDPGVIVKGGLIDKHKKPMGFKGGQWISQREEGKIISFFTNKEGKFNLSSVPQGRYKLELFDHPDIDPVIIEVPDGSEGDYYAGELIIL